ncbi:MAG: hypothetical protein JNL96_13845 [Planctomycetaceae bacterium]|nr:hypothetical protein [Planctomycetaceae bacterium]
MVSNRQSESTPIEFYELQFETALFCRMDGVDGLVLVDCDVLHGGFTGPKGELESWWGPSTCVDRFSGERPRMMRVPFDKVIRQYVLALSSLEEKQLGWRYFVVSPEVMEKAVREKSLLVIPDMPSLPRVEDDHEIAAMLALAIKTDEETQARINREAQSQGL